MSDISIKEKANKFCYLKRNLPRTFSDTLVWHMKQRGFKVKDLENITGISARAISRYRNQIKIIEAEKVIAICIAMKLEPEFCFDLLEKAGILLRTDMRHELMYDSFINLSGTITLIECNEMLIDAGFEPLTDEVSEDYENGTDGKT